MLPEVFSVSARLAHTAEHPLTVKVLKGRANDAVWVELTEETLTTLREEMDMCSTVDKKTKRVVHVVQTVQCCPTVLQDKLD